MTLKKVPMNTVLRRPNQSLKGTESQLALYSNVRVSKDYWTMVVTTHITATMMYGAAFTKPINLSGSVNTIIVRKALAATYRLRDSLHG